MENIRKATTRDFEPLYKIGLETPEFKVGTSGDFMERDEFLSAIENPNGTFFIAEADGKAIGFIYANRKDVERAPKTRWACLVYIVVKPKYRKMGIAQRLYEKCAKELRSFGVNNIYCWANSESDGSIVKFMKKNNFSEGHKYIWMDKEI